jgi:hypothetical protein
LSLNINNVGHRYGIKFSSAIQKKYGGSILPNSIIAQVVNASSSTVANIPVVPSNSQTTTFVDTYLTFTASGTSTTLSVTVNYPTNNLDETRLAIESIEIYDLTDMQNQGMISGTTYNDFVNFNIANDFHYNFLFQKPIT